MTRAEGQREKLLERFGTLPGARILRECVVCERPFYANPRHLESHVHCSSLCRRRAYAAQKQLVLEWEPPADPIPVPVDPGLDAEDRKALGGANRMVLARLRQGPATNVELQKLGCGQRPSARCHDVREWLKRRGFTVQNKRIRRGVYLYWIEALS